MAVVFEDETRRLVIGVGDLVRLRPQRGHLRMEAVLGSSARMAAGRQAHSDWQQAREDEDSAFHAEVSLSVRLVIREWECHVRGRLDGLSFAEGAWLIEEVKSTMLSSERILSAGGAVGWTGRSKRRSMPGLCMPVVEHRSMHAWLWFHSEMGSSMHFP